MALEFVNCKTPERKKWQDTCLAAGAQKIRKDSLRHDPQPLLHQDKESHWSKRSKLLGRLEFQTGLFKPFHPLKVFRIEGEHGMIGKVAGPRRAHLVWLTAEILETEHCPEPRA